MPVLRDNTVMEIHEAESIPDISFLKRKNQPEIEVLKFDRLFQRRESLTPSPEKPHRVDFYVLIYIISGSGVHFIDFKPYQFDNGSIILVSKGQVHAFNFNRVKDGVLIFFTDAFLSKHLIHSDMLSLHKLYNYHLHHPVMTPDASDGEGFRSVIAELDREYRMPDDFAREELLRLLLKVFLLKMERLTQTLIPAKINPEYILLFSTFKNHLDRHVRETRNASDYARMMGISYKHLNDICKRVTGHTAKRFIDTYVILEIKRYLATTGYSVKELAYELGFDETTNFIKYFLKHTKTTPARFRQSMKT